MNIKKKKLYTWTLKGYDDMWEYGFFNSVDECIKDAKEHHGIPKGYTIIIGIQERFIPSLNINRILDDMINDAQEEIGDSALDWLKYNPQEGFIDSKKLQAAFNNDLYLWLIKTKQIDNFYKIVPFTEYTL